MTIGIPLSYHGAILRTVPRIKEQLFECCYTHIIDSVSHSSYLRCGMVLESSQERFCP